MRKIASIIIVLLFAQENLCQLSQFVTEINKPLNSNTIEIDSNLLIDESKILKVPNQWNVLRICQDLPCVILGKVGIDIFDKKITLYAGESFDTFNSSNHFSFKDTTNFDIYVTKIGSRKTLFMSKKSSSQVEIFFYLDEPNYDANQWMQHFIITSTNGKFTKVDVKEILFILKQYIDFNS